jgi:hypothetical protein
MSFILGSALCTRMNKPAVEQEETATSPEPANPVIPDSSQPPLASRYLDMLVKVDQAPFIHDFLAGLFTWLLLTGYIDFPGAFKSLDNTNAVNELGTVRKTVLAMAQKELLRVVAVFCILVTIGIDWLW